MQFAAAEWQQSTIVKTTLAGLGDGLKHILVDPAGLDLVMVLNLKAELNAAQGVDLDKTTLYQAKEVSEVILDAFVKLPQWTADHRAYIDVALGLHRRAPSNAAILQQSDAVVHFYELSLASQVVAEQCEAVKGDNVVFNCLKAFNNCSAEVGLLIFWATKASETLISAKKHSGTDKVLADVVTRLDQLSLRSQTMIESIGRHHLLDRRAKSEELKEN